MTSRKRRLASVGTLYPCTDTLPTQIHALNVRGIEKTGYMIHTYSHNEPQHAGPEKMKGREKEQLSSLQRPTLHNKPKLALILLVLLHRELLLRVAGGLLPF